MRYRRLLMVYPEFPKTYWGMQYFLPLIGKKALMPPLGLITIGALAPSHYEIRLVADYTYASSRDLDTSTVLPRRPRHRAQGLR